MKYLIFAIILVNILFASWYVLHGDLYFHTDIARDFLLLKELEDKKIVFIGPRSGAAGFFHGPLWTYINYPVYYLSNGNPIASGYFWVFLAVMILWATFFLATKIFGDYCGYISTLLLSFILVGITRDFTHPHMGMLVTPFFIYTLIRYRATFRLIYLLFHILSCGILIQLEIASGLPFTFLSFGYLIYLQAKNRKLIHLLLYPVLLIPLANYLFFDLRHNFFLTRNFYHYIKEDSSEYYVGFSNILKNRLEYIPGFVLDLTKGNFELNIILSLIILFFLILLLSQNNKSSYFYKIFLYFFVGYFIISLKSRYYLLIQHFFAFIPIVMIVVSSIFTSKYWKYLLMILILIVSNNEIQTLRFISSFKNFTGENESSWRFYADLSRKIFKAGREKEFGYFIYTPDKLSYSPKYAMVYGQKNNPEKKAYYFKKKPITYVIVAPPPKNDPYMSGDWWIENTINIKKKPEKVITFPNGYMIKKYELTEQEVKIPFDPSADTGIHFR